GRGRVSSTTAAAILSMAEQLGYEPNPAGKALAARKHRPVIGVILSSEGNAFFDEVIRGIKEAYEEYQIYGLEVKYKTMKGYDENKQIELLEQFRGNVNALAINPINSPQIAKILNEFVEAGIFVVTVNNDIANCNRQCFVGSDYFNGGETACALFEAILGKKAKIGVVLGSLQIMGHRSRLEGFQHRMKKLPEFEILDVVENDDDEITSYNVTKQLLEKYPQITALFLVAGGVYGASRAVLDLPEENRPKVIAFDAVPSTVEMMKKGVILAILYQHPYRQGHRSIDLAFEYLVNGRAPAKAEYVFKNEIRLLENL
ncbi:MAG: LacI family DNA-binding transcriptional regulator, partial [Selenomonadaceae bacterium]|nr:LacI family DNA-binding transcriptional regulator [Selenomonadaceae bacterium]